MRLDSFPMDLSKVIVPKLVLLPEDIPELHLPISLNMVECPSSKDHSPPDPCQINSLQVSNSLVSKAAMVLHLLSHQANTKASRWVTEVQPAPVATAVVLSKLPTSNGVPQPVNSNNKTSATALVATKDDDVHLLHLIGTAFACN